MVLRFVIGIAIIGGGFFPGVGLCQLMPRLQFADQSVKAVNLDKDVLSIVQQNWRDEHWSEVFGIYTWHAHQNKIRQPLAGHYRVEGMGVHFTPLFPFAAGETFFAEMDYEGILKKTGVHTAEQPNGTNRNTDLIFSIPASITQPTFVESVYPDTDTLPANLLRMYIYFSAPMSTDEAYKHIQIQDANGNIIDKPFLVVDQELWDSDRQRFTLLFDPGRIKRGIKSNLDLGMPLQEGHIYHLVIDSAWRDEHGNNLASNYEKRMVVTSPVREKLSKEFWKIIEPEASSKSPLVVQFEKTLDHVLALKYIVVSDEFGNTIHGETMMRGDKVWMFSPEKPWTAGQYLLQISPYLEDPAGNNFNNAFDVDLSVDKRVNSEEPIVISFKVDQELN